MVTSPPPAPGAASPASAQARSRAAARADRMAFSARGRSAASWLTSRDTTGSDATGPASSGCSRSTAMSARQSPPSATAAARSAMILPGSCTARGARHRGRPCDRPRPRPEAPAQAGDPHRLPQQDSPGLGDQAPAIGRHRDAGSTCAILHLKSLLAGAVALPREFGAGLRVAGWCGAAVALWRGSWPGWLIAPCGAGGAGTMGAGCP